MGVREKSVQIAPWIAVLVEAAFAMATVSAIRVKHLPIAHPIALPVRPATTTAIVMWVRIVIIVPVIAALVSVMATAHAMQRKIAAPVRQSVGAVPEKLA